MSARSFGKAEIRRVKSIKKIIRLKTYEHVSIGQRCYVNIDDYDIDGYYVVKQVGLKCRANGKVQASVVLEDYS